MSTFRRALAAVAFVELWVAMAAFVFVIVLTMVQVSYRYLLSGSIWWAQEIAQLAMLVAYFLGIAYVYKAKQDIIVGFLLKRLPRQKADDDVLLRLVDVGDAEEIRDQHRKLRDLLRPPDRARQQVAIADLHHRQDDDEYEGRHGDPQLDECDRRQCLAEGVHSAGAG